MPEVKTALVAKRNQLYTMTYTYKQRRAEIRRNLGIKVGDKRTKVPDTYHTSVIAINRKIWIWAKRIKRIDRISEEIGKIERAVVKFTGVKIKGSYGKNFVLAKSIYYKYGLENGYRGIDLREYIRRGYRHEPARYRKSFTKSFKATPENKDTWLRFKRFYEKTPPEDII